MNKEEIIKVVLDYINNCEIQSVQISRGIKKIDERGASYHYAPDQTATIKIQLLEKK